MTQIRIKRVYEEPNATDGYRVLVDRLWPRGIKKERKKGRDLFDLYVALTKAEVDVNELMRCYHRYMSFAVQQPPTYKQFVANMEEKMVDPDFLGDTQLLLRPDEPFDPIEGYKAVKERLIENMQ